MTKTNIASLWGDFEELEDQVVEETPTEKEKKKPEENDDPEGKDNSETDEGGEGEGDQLDDEGQDPPDSQDGDDKDKKKPEDTPGDDDPIVKAFDAIADGLETEDLLFLEDDKTYEPTPEGFKAMMKDNIEAYRTKMEKEFEEREKGIRREYEEQNTPSVMDLDPENETDAENMLRKYYKEIGLDDDEIKENLKDAKTLDNLAKEAKIAQRYLGKKEKEEKEAQALAAQKAEDDKVKKVQEYVDSVKGYIDETEEMAGFKLTPKIKKGFKEYLFKKDKDGLTPAQKASKDPERRVRLAFLDYMDFNKNDFEIKAKSELAKNYSKKVSRFTSTQAQSKGVTIQQKEEKEGLQPGFTDFWSPTD